MVNLEKLKKTIQRQGYSYSDIAKELDVTRSCISHKMSGAIEFKVSQVEKLAEFLGLSDKEKEEIFCLEEKNKIDTTNDADLVKAQPLSADEKGMLMHDIINILADRGCTIEDTENILHGTLRSIRSTSKVKRLEW